MNKFKSSCFEITRKYSHVNANHTQLSGTPCDVKAWRFVNCERAEQVQKKCFSSIAEKIGM